jgi:O-succinylbenzoic acid--CoA ligase
MADYQFVHPQFKLNGFSFTKDDLCRVAYAYIKEGDDYEKAIGLFLLNWFDESLTIQVTTSGTTGPPKKITINKQAMLASAAATSTYFKLAPGIHALLCLSVQFIAGKMMLVRAMQGGWQLDVVKPSVSPIKNRAKPYDFVAMIPMQVSQSLKQIKQIKTLLIGGASLSNRLRDLLVELEVQAYESYGMTETITHIAVKSIREPNFNALPGVSFALNENQCLRISAPRISTDAIQTNDIVDLIDAKQFRFLGRIDTVINSGGIKLFPELIEQKLAAQLPHRFYIIGKPNEEWGEQALLVIESVPYVLPANVFDCLNKYEKPKQIIFLPHFQETASGKIIRKLPD